MDKILQLDEFMSMVRRRILVFGIVVTVGSLLSFFYAIGLPREYETSAVIQIEGSSVSENIATTSDTSRSIQQLQRTEQRLMASDHLVSVIKKFNLFADLPAASLNDKIYLLRMATRIEQVTNPAFQWRTDMSPTALTITVRLGDPDQVALVANEFSNSVLKHNRRNREDRVREALEFFESEEVRVGTEIAALDTEIADFKKENADSLPEAVLSKRTQIAGLEETDLVLEQQLIELTSGQGTDRRPVIIKQIEQINEQRAAIAERRDAIATSIKSAPKVEKTFNTLRRRLSLLEEQYTVITRHRAEAEMGQMLEVSRQSEMFVVLEVAKVPDSPIAPSRKKIFAMGFAGSVSLAAALVFLLENLNPVLRSAAQMERQLNMRPVVVIPNIDTTARFTRRWLTRAAIVLVLLIGVPFALLLVNEHVIPLGEIAGVAKLPNLIGR